MYYPLFTISLFIGMVFFYLSIYNNNKWERVAYATLSCLTAFILALLSMDIEYITVTGTIIQMRSYALALLFVLIAFVQLLRIFFLPVENMEGEFNAKKNM